MGNMYSGIDVLIALSFLAGIVFIYLLIGRIVFNLCMFHEDWSDGKDVELSAAYFLRRDDGFTDIAWPIIAVGYVVCFISHAIYERIKVIEVPGLPDFMTKTLTVKGKKK